MPLISALARTSGLGPWHQHFDDESWHSSCYIFLAESTFFVSLFCDLGLTFFKGQTTEILAPDIYRAITELKDLYAKEILLNFHKVEAPI